MRIMKLWYKLVLGEVPCRSDNNADDKAMVQVVLGEVPCRSSNNADYEAMVHVRPW